MPHDPLDRSVFVSLMYLYASFERPKDVAIHIVQEIRQGTAARQRQEGAEDWERDTP